MEMNQYLDIFIEEASEHLQSMNECLLKLESTPQDHALLNEIFRVSHTIKGMAATMGFTNMSNLTHEMENVLHEIRNGKIHISTEIIDVLFQCFDVLEDYTANIASDGEEGSLDSEVLIKSLHNILHNDKASTYVNEDNGDNNQTNIQMNSYVVDVMGQASEKGLKSYNIRIDLEENCMLKAARAFIVFKTLEEQCDLLQTTPSVEDIEDENFESEISIIVITKLDQSAIMQALEGISEVKNINIEEINPEMNEIKDDDSQNVIITQSDDNDKAENTNKLNHKKNQGPKVGKTVRVDIDRLDTLMNLVSELIIIKTRMEDIEDKDQKNSMNEAIEYLERITTNLHDAVMKVRMVPIERVFNRFPRMVRDLAKELNKNINLIMSGEETEVDRTIIDEIGDPLVHLIRNSIDHGIEKPKDRLVIGKEEQGTVTLSAYPDGNNVVIEVQDDGGGINTEKIVNKAIKNNILTRERAKQLQKDEIAELLFEPGFSMAEKITDISGRGVGLDVVKSKIESIGGTVEVKSTKDIGTKFIIRLPLTLAIIQALLIKLQHEIYAIPLSSIKEISPIKSRDIKRVQNQEVVLFRNKTIPVIRLKDKLKLNKGQDESELIAVIVKKGEKEAMLIIDELIGQQEIVIKSLGKFLSNIPYIAGATVLGNGKISLILDINSLF